MSNPADPQPALAVDDRRTPDARAFWAAFCRASGVAASAPWGVDRFGDGPEMSARLIELVLHGPKRATTSLVREYPDGNFPAVGEHTVITHWDGRPALIWRTVEIVRQPLNRVDDRFARDEGEGHRDREEWLAGHLRFFRAQAAREGWEMREDIEAIFERFAVVWPDESADR